MIFELRILHGFIAFAIWLLYMSWKRDQARYGVPGLFLLVICFMVFMETRPEKVAERAAAAEAERRAAIPHVIREVDGCKVYAFNAGGHTHYFTRCGSNVTTTRHYTEKVSSKCGKSTCTKDVPRQETIVTEEQQ